MSILLAMDKIRKKEVVNQYKAKLMKQAIDKIRKLPQEEIRKRISCHQDRVLKEAELHEMLQAGEETRLTDKTFSMVSFLLI